MDKATDDLTSLKFTDNMGQAATMNANARNLSPMEEEEKRPRDDPSGINMVKQGSVARNESTYQQVGIGPGEEAMVEMNKDLREEKKPQAKKEKKEWNDDPSATNMVKQDSADDENQNMFWVTEIDKPTQNQAKTLKRGAKCDRYSLPRHSLEQRRLGKI